MKKFFIIAIMSMALSVNVSAQHGSVKGKRPTGHSISKANGNGGYMKGHSTVYFRNKTIKGAHAGSFNDLGRGYAKDNFNVY